MGVCASLGTKGAIAAVEFTGSDYFLLVIKYQLAHGQFVSRPPFLVPRRNLGRKASQAGYDKEVPRRLRRMHVRNRHLDQLWRVAQRITDQPG